MAKTTVSVRMVGADDLLEKLRKLNVRMEDVLEPAATDGADVLAKQSNQRAPGPHVVVEIDPKKRTRHAVTAQIGPDKAHWFYQFFETGTVRHKARSKRGMIFPGYGPFAGQTIVTRSVAGIPARPFLRPAVDEHGKQAAQAAFDRFLAEMKRVANGH